MFKPSSHVSFRDLSSFPFYYFFFTTWTFFFSHAASIIFASRSPLPPRYIYRSRSAAFKLNVVSQRDLTLLSIKLPSSARIPLALHRPKEFEVVLLVEAENDEPDADSEPARAEDAGYITRRDTVCVYALTRRDVAAHRDARVNVASSGRLSPSVTTGRERARSAMMEEVVA